MMNCALKMCLGAGMTAESWVGSGVSISYIPHSYLLGDIYVIEAVGGATEGTSLTDMSAQQSKLMLSWR